MWAMLLGLLIFLGVHSIRIAAPGWREQRIAAWGEGRWKIGYSVVSAVGLALLIWGYGQARLQAPPLWATPTGLQHVAGLLMLVSMVLLVATYVPRNHFKSALRHPMVLSVKLWALAHLLANNTPADLVFFGSFLLWAVLDFRSARRRATPPPSGATASGTAIVLVIGVGAWVALIFGGHQWITGVRPFPTLGA